MSQQLLVDQESDISFLPPWLVSQAPKRKKQVVSLDELDFEEVVSSKPKGKKKPKTLSKLHMEARHKFVEVAEPPQGKNCDEVNIEEYTVTRIDLGKITHTSVKEDAQTSLTILMEKYDKMKESKDAYKVKAEQCNAILRKITNSLKNVEPVATSIEEPLV